MTLTPNNPKNNPLNGLKHQFEFLDFVEWIATPSALRRPKTQQELAKTFGVGSDALSSWKNRPGFWTSVIEKRKQWGRERTPDVILALYNRIIKTGSAAEVKLWLCYFDDWSERLVLTRPLSVYRPYADLTDEELEALLEKEKKTLLKK